MMALPMNSLYSLTWGDYGTSLVSAIQLLRCHGDLVDCTLAAGGRSFPAHKIVLCAASPFLLDLLKNTPCKHPVVMLAGVNANDLEALLEFVYRGEVSVDHAQLPSLLQAAQCLNIQGLAPQTVTKDDFTTHSIQLQHMIPQHHHDQDQLIATIAAAPQQTVHAQVVEDIHQAGQILQTATQQAVAGQQQTIVTADATKDVIQQFLPARKRRPRVKKMSPTAPKVAKVEGMDTISTSTATHSGNVENGNENGPGITSTPLIKSEIPKVEAMGNVDPNMTPIASNANNTGVDSSGGTLATTTPGTKTGKRSKNTSATGSGDKPRSRSQSEQPATCPICYAVIRQSRNLRRHLELRHFAKPGVKKEKKSKSDGEGEGNPAVTVTLAAGARPAKATTATTISARSTLVDPLSITDGEVFTTLTPSPSVTSSAATTTANANAAPQNAMMVSHSGTSQQVLKRAAGSSAARSGGQAPASNVVHIVSEEVFGP